MWEKSNLYATDSIMRRLHKMHYPQLVYQATPIDLDIDNSVSPWLFFRLIIYVSINSLMEKYWIENETPDHLS